MKTLSPSTDLVSRLRAYIPVEGQEGLVIRDGLRKEAADEIEALRHDLERAMANHNADLNALRGPKDEALEMLRMLEFILPYGGGRCPVCLGWEVYKGQGECSRVHTKSCSLKALLDSRSATPSAERKS